MSSDKTSTTNSSTTNSLPDWLTSPYQQATKQATQLSQQPAIGTQTQNVLDRTFADSAAGSAAANSGTNLLSQFAQGNFGSYGDSLIKSANGDYLTADSNPYIKGVAQQGADAAQAAINSQFGSAGRSNGSGLYAQLFGQGISNAANSVYAQNYENERQRQQAAAGGLLNTQLSATNSLPSLIAAGTNANQAGLAAGQYQDNAQMEKLRQYTSLLTALSSPFGQQTSNSTTKESSGGLGSVLGSIAQIGGAIAAPFTGGASLGIGSALGGALSGSGGGSSILTPGLSGGLNLPSWLPGLSA